MIEISHIVSSDLLDLIKDRPFYMCLANVACEDENYKNFYKKQIEKGKFVLMDVGTAEFNQIPIEITLEMIKYIHPSEIILNDVLSNCDETLKESKKALDFYKNNNIDCQFMFVPQGNNFEEWKRCLDSFEDIDKISTIGVSKFNTSAWKDSEARLKCCEYINEKLPNMKIHLLGCHENIDEIKIIASKCKNIRSNDTAIAFIYAQAGKTILDGNRPEGTINFIHSDFDKEKKDLLEENIVRFDIWVK